MKGRLGGDAAFHLDERAVSSGLRPPRCYKFLCRELNFDARLPRSSRGSSGYHR
jgi:hypothetical protein